MEQDGFVSRLEPMGRNLCLWFTGVCCKHGGICTGKSNLLHVGPAILEMAPPGIASRAYNASSSSSKSGSALRSYRLNRSRAESVSRYAGEASRA